jgi:AMP-polyphosphate phosphotransferase
MFESANLDDRGRRVSKQAYKREALELRRGLLEAQYALDKGKKFATVILVAGVQGAGRGRTVNLLNEWMDPRRLATHAFGEPSEDERERPEQWRFWQTLPPKGRIAVLFGAWHTGPIMRHARGKSTNDEFTHDVEQVVRLERMLADEGILLLKYWFHISRKQQRKRLRQAGEKPETRYSRFVEVSADFLRRTSAADARWEVIPGGEKRLRSLAFGRHLLGALRARLDARKPSRPRALHANRPAGKRRVLTALEPDQTLNRQDYEKQLHKWQSRLSALARHRKFASHAVVAVFEGQDAAGKGGAIRRVTSALDARIYQNVQIAAPTEEEAARPYLWRFWRHVPRRGRFAIFDRSWYGRVLVERVEGLCKETDWKRAYSEINEFEEGLVHHGIVVAKFWLAISKAEQLERFRERQRVPVKRFKITPEDWRNRRQWTAHEQAASDMVAFTSTRIAPWTLVEADNKRFARIKVLKTLCQAIDRALG